MTAKTSSRGKAHLFLPILSTVVILSVVAWLLSRGTPGGQFVLPFFVPALYSVSTFVGLSIGFLAIGRFRVLPDPPSYWIAVAFLSFGVLSVFVVLTFPLLELDGQGLIATLPNTAAWVGQIQMTFLAAALVLATAAPWPRLDTTWSFRWIAGLVLLLFVVIAGAIGLTSSEERLPLLVLEGGAYAPLQIYWVLGILILLVGGALLSTRSYLRTKDSLVGYVAITQVAFVFAIVTAYDVTRFTSLWYISRLLGLVGLGVTLFGLLYEYVTLFHGERQARRETAERAQQLFSTLESMGDAVFVADAGGKVTMTNRAARSLLGVPESEDNGMQVLDLSNLLEIRDLDGRSLPPAEIPFAKALAGVITRNQDLLAKSMTTGKEFVFRSSAAPVISEGEIIGAVALGTDVTELIRMERMKEDFIRVAAHELKTPLTIMKGYAQVLPETLERKPEARDRVLEAIDRGADRINGLVQDLLDISQLQVGEINIRRERVDLRQLTEAAILELGPLGAGREVSLSSGDPVMVWGDGERLKNVAFRLIENAVKYSPRGGPIIVVVESRGEKALFSVADQGIGIPEDKQEHVFERFFRAHAGTAHDFGGMGVGLYITKALIEAMGGRVWFESERGKGSTFGFDLPLGGEDAR